MSDTTRDARPASGRFVVRIDPALHASLRQAARTAGTSLNHHCVRKLASPRAPLDSTAAAVVGRATTILKDSLLGVVAFGSWARRDESSTSDMDVLLITGDNVAISRSLYRQWDAGPDLDWDGHEVSPHFASLPSENERVSGLWAEVAVDGLILFERALLVSRRLASIRRRMLDGKISLRVAGGQRYWVHEP